MIRPDSTRAMFRRSRVVVVSQWNRTQIVISITSVVVECVVASSYRSRILVESEWWYRLYMLRWNPDSIRNEGTHTQLHHTLYTFLFFFFREYISTTLCNFVLRNLTEACRRNLGWPEPTLTSNSYSPGGSMVIDGIRPTALRCATAVGI